MLTQDDHKVPSNALLRQYIGTIGQLEHKASPLQLSTPHNANVLYRPLEVFIA